MDKSWIYCDDNYGAEFSKGLYEFIEMAKNYTNDEKKKLVGPCSKLETHSSWEKRGDLAYGPGVL